MDTLFPPRETEVPCGEEQVRAPCGASQPRPFGRGSAVAEMNPAPTLLPPRLLVNGRATPARLDSNTSCREALALRDVEPSRERRTSPDRARCRARRPVAREGRFPWTSAKRTHVVAHPRCFSVAGPPRERMGRPLFPNSIAGEERGSTKRFFNLRPTSVAWTMLRGGWGLDLWESKLSHDAFP